MTLHGNKECDVGDNYLLILYICMRKFALICFVVAVLCYGLGALFAYYDWLIDWNDYLKIIAVVGGLASVLGILGLVFSPFKDLNSKMHFVRTIYPLYVKLKKLHLQRVSSQVTFHTLR